jgi:phage baseplate assembly protein W
MAALGSDLALTRYTGTPSAVALDTADSWRGLDLAVVPAVAGAQPATADLGRVAGRENLAQALIVRLLTARGDLAPLGHPDFGSRLGELIGERNDGTACNRARLYTLQALAAEPRVRAVLDLAVVTTAAQPDALQIAFSVLPVGDEDPLALALEVTL